MAIDDIWFRRSGIPVALYCVGVVSLRPYPLLLARNSFVISRFGKWPAWIRDRAESIVTRMLGLLIHAFIRLLVLLAGSSQDKHRLKLDCPGSLGRLQLTIRSGGLIGSGGVGARITLHVHAPGVQVISLLFQTPQSNRTRYIALMNFGVCVNARQAQQPISMLLAPSTSSIGKATAGRLDVAAPDAYADMKY